MTIFFFTPKLVLWNISTIPGIITYGICTDGKKLWSRFIPFHLDIQFMNIILV